MTAETFIKKLLKGLLENMFDLDKLRFNKVVIEKEVVENIILLSKQNHPKEFLAFLDGNIKNNRLTINGLLYQEYHASTESAAPIFHFPDKSFYGSVHSHPGYSNRPSSADRQFFSKIGIVNIIICRPYDLKSIRFYNHEGEEINVEIEE
ncbi:MAG: Mov34/MPN/PAD-1 family protein [Candidatus Woesearchaeota archaeon]